MNTVSSNTSINLWLKTLIFMVLTMVFIGGVTRLTDSGLSMVDWRPIMGSIPPLTEAEWQNTFESYKKFPEYQKVNLGMTLSEFKKIFFWEYFHRLFGRLIGLAFFFPFIIFLFQKKLSKDLIKKTAVAFALGGLQGLMGWYMVKSGLVNRPDVSQFRLAAHLLLAFLIIGYLYWLVLEIKYPVKKYSFKNPGSKFVLTFFVLLIGQYLFGAFVAGLDAGLTHNTFPKMGRSWIPVEAMFIEGMALLNNPVFVQFTHRVLGIMLLSMCIGFLLVKPLTLKFQQRKSIYMLCAVTLGQFLLGVLTLVLYVPISVASLHQVVGCLLLLVMVRSLFFTLRT